MEEEGEEEENEEEEDEEEEKMEKEVEEGEAGSVSGEEDSSVDSDDHSRGQSDSEREVDSLLRERVARALGNAAAQSGDEVRIITGFSPGLFTTVLCHSTV